jgi:hypothetical protein
MRLSVRFGAGIARRAANPVFTKPPDGAFAFQTVKELRPHFLDPALGGRRWNCVLPEIFLCRLGLR